MAEAPGRGLAKPRSTLLSPQPLVDESLNPQLAILRRRLARTPCIPLTTLITPLYERKAGERTVTFRRGRTG